MEVKFLTNRPIAYIPSIKSLVITDLHLGIEHELYQKGIFIPPQADTFFKILKQAIKTTRAKKIIILGDVKHEVPGISFRELKEIPRFFSKLVKICKVVITKGNHDDQIEKILPTQIKIYTSRGFKLGQYGFFHGHAWPSKELLSCNWLFMGHIQPAIEFQDILGYRIVERVWIKCKLSKQMIRKKYGIKPKIQAGLHVGSVVTSEIGEIKTQIVFSGDTMNTTSRILGKCADLNLEVLASEVLIMMLGKQKNYNLESIGNYELKGKQEKVSLFEINQKTLSHV